MAGEGNNIEAPGAADAALMDDAVSFLENLQAEGEEPAAEPAEPADDVEEVEAAPTEEEAQDTEEPGEEEAPDDEDAGDESEEAKADDAEEKPAKKPSTYQRMKAKTERLKKELATVQEESDTVRSQYQALEDEVREWPSLLEAQQEEIGRLRDALSAAGYEQDPRDAGMAKLKAKIDSLESQGSRTAERSKRDAERDHQKQVNVMARQMRDEAEDLAEEMGLDPSEILRANFLDHEGAKARGEQGREMRDVAEELAELERFRANKRGVQRLKEQKPAKKPPKTLGTGPQARGDFPATTEGASAYLKSLGLD